MQLLYNHTMSLDVSFGSPWNASSPGLDGMVVAFPFTVRKTYGDARQAVVSDHLLKVSISGTLSTLWGFGRLGLSNDQLVKTLFAFGRREVAESLEQGSLGETVEVSLNTSSAPIKNPFDTDSIEDPDGFGFTVNTNEDVPTKLADPDIQVPPEIVDSLRRFRADHPSEKRSAFVMMQFGDSIEHQVLLESTRNVLRDLGIVALRADDKEYHDDLFPNVLTYLHGCGFGVALIDRIEDDRLNPNVALEIGYMFAIGKPVCILKDREISILTTDLVSKLYKEYDADGLPESLRAPIVKWLTDRDLIPAKEPDPDSGFSKAYFGHQKSVRAFVTEAFSFEVFPTVSRIYADGVSDLAFHYTGDLPESFFNRLAAKHGLAEGKYEP